MKDIIIIDSGIDKQYRQNKSFCLEESRNFCDNSNISIIDDNVGHGTAIASIVYPSFASVNSSKIIILKIYDDALEQDEECLFRVMDYCIQKKYSSSIIHMSLGLNYYSAQLEKKCQELYNNNNLLVAAFDNAGSISYPAIFDCVIGVEASDICTRRNDFYIPENKIVNVFAKGGVHKVAGIGDSVVLKQGNSMSAAYVSACLLKWDAPEYTISSALEHLKHVSTLRHGVFHFDVTPFEPKCQPYELVKKMKKAALFPYNKEISSIIKFANMLEFDLQSVYSSKYIGNVGRRVSTFFNSCEYLVKNIDNVNFSEFDTLILGHVSQLEHLTNKKIKEKILNDCLEHNVNVFSLDYHKLNEYEKKFEDAGLLLTTPYCEKPSNIYNGKLFRMKTPIVGVFGTSSSQGKFTVQMLLRSEFQKNSYKVAQLSSEPTGMFFGIEKTAIFGYESNMHLSDNEFMGYINQQLHDLDLLDADIIIAGSQSGTIPESYFHIGHLAIKQIEFLIALQSDAVILCINPTDTLEYINRTINTIENLTTSKVIALVLYPFYYKNGWQMINHQGQQLVDEQIMMAKEKYHKEFKRPCLVVNLEEDLRLLFEEVVQFFS